jgi:hypothetical protein
MKQMTRAEALKAAQMIHQSIAWNDNERAVDLILSLLDPDYYSKKAAHNEMYGRNSGAAVQAKP